MDIFRRDIAPIINEAWQEIDALATHILKTYLSARKVIEVHGPFGWDYSALNLGRLKLVEESGTPGLNVGLRQVQPLVEARVPFVLNLWELDNTARGARALDLQALEDAAKKIATFEDRLIYFGFPSGGVPGLAKTLSHKPMTLGREAKEYPAKIVQGLISLQDAGIEGPYSLVLGREPFRLLMSVVEPYPPKQQIEKEIGGPIILSEALEGGLLISQRGGDFELVLGQDITIGFEHADTRSAHLFLTETLTFRVIEPKAAFPFL